MAIVFMTWSKRLKRGSLRAAGTVPSNHPPRSQGGTRAFRYFRHV